MSMSSWLSLASLTSSSQLDVSQWSPPPLFQLLHLCGAPGSGKQSSKVIHLSPFGVMRMEVVHI